MSPPIIGTMIRALGPHLIPAPGREPNQSRTKTSVSICLEKFFYLVAYGVMCIDPIDIEVGPRCPLTPHISQEFLQK